MIYITLHLSLYSIPECETMTVIKKVVLLGDPAVGKTSLVRRFVFDMFDDHYIATIGAKVVKKEMVVDGSDLKLMIWDLLGQENFDRLVSSTLKGVEGAFIVFDLTRKDTVNRIPKFMSIVDGITGSVPPIILGNKNDIESDIEVGVDDIREYTVDIGNPYYVTSAKTGENVELAFQELGRMLLNLNKE